MNARNNIVVKADPGRELLILGVVRRQPMSAYSIDRTVRNHAPLYRPFRRGNIYHLVDRLSEAGLMRRGSSKAKRGPSRLKDVFHLSAAGEDRFQALLREVMVDVQAADATLEIALVLLGQLRRSNAIALLMMRATELTQQTQRLRRLIGDHRSRTGAAYLGLSHIVHRVQSEQRFVREALRRAQNPRWDPDWVLDDGAVTDPARKL